ncbi:hypothetical protein GKQ77_01525 [Streptomyces sp. BG9H]|uniref:Uncharacterized protein n=1 Tax=Streptomyces anatolicus TaxID=2675858 RepID=A0ABS6YFR3_9ACTN|nr:hypothetical protein [Streptomyces anatolicus]MBW5420250.1 hypothetical protein [Streptomyces anatolicus]
MSHTARDAELEPVPCPPCLVALLTGGGTEPHGCLLTTTLAVDGTRIVILAREMDCRCRCPSAEESAALKTARAQARGGRAE